MFCSNCGNEVNGNFCQNCGTRIGEDMEPVPESREEVLIQETERKFLPTSKVGILEIDSNSKQFRVAGKFEPKKKMGFGKKALAVYTMGMSVAVEATVKAIAKTSMSDCGIHSFGDLIEFELLEDDNQITKGGTGKALGVGVAAGVVFNPLVGGLGAIAGGVTGKRVTKKQIESLIIRITVNDVNNPCILIPLITESTKTKSKEYERAFTLAQQTISALNAIANNQ